MQPAQKKWIVNSFFDDDLETFWQEINIEKDYKSKIFEKDVFFRARKVLDKKLKKILIAIDENNIYYGNLNEEKIEFKKKISLKNLRFEYYVNDSNENNIMQFFPYSFRFYKNKSFFEIFTHEKGQYNKWFELLRYKLIKHNFHEVFKVTKVIGKGHFAKVYFATHRDNNNKQFAIKAFNKENLLSQATGKPSLVNEIEIMKKLNHPNILKLYEIFETENSIYMVNGGELLKNMQNEQYDSKNIMKIINKLLSACEHMHKNNVMHRDIKPDNILLREKDSLENIVLADFGLSTFIDENEKLFKRCGTPGYVAPEVLFYKEGNPFYNEKCDLFSIGVIFYIFLTGKKLFRGKDQKEVILLNRECKIDYKIPQLEKTDKDTIDLLKQLLNPDPNSRISASEALNHPYFKNIPSTNEIFKQIEDDFVKSNEFKSFGPSFGSFVIKKSIKHGINDTLESLSNNNSNMEIVFYIYNILKGKSK